MTREAWELIAEDLVRTPVPSSKHFPVVALPPPPVTAAAAPALLQDASAVPRPQVRQAPTSLDESTDLLPNASSKGGVGGGGSGVNDAVDPLPGNGDANPPQPQQQRQQQYCGDFGGGTSAAVTAGAATSGAAGAAAAAAAGISGNIDDSAVLATAAACAVGPQDVKTGGRGDGRPGKAYFVPVEDGMSSYCPRDLVHETAEGTAAAGTSAVAGGRRKDGLGSRRARRGDVDVDDLRAFEFIGIMIGANLIQREVRKGCSSV